MSHTDDANRRGCYCGLWDTQPEFLFSQGLPQGYCGHCEKCGRPGHTRHFPGPVPYTGSWCNAHYRRLLLLDPRTSTGGLLWVGAIGLIIFIARSSCAGR